MKAMRDGLGSIFNGLKAAKEKAANVTQADLIESAKNNLEYSKTVASNTADSLKSGAKTAAEIAKENLLIAAVDCLGQLWRAASPAARLVHHGWVLATSMAPLVGAAWPVRVAAWHATTAFAEHAADDTLTAATVATLMAAIDLALHDGKYGTVRLGALMCLAALVARGAALRDRLQPHAGAIAALLAHASTDRDSKVLVALGGLQPLWTRLAL